MQVKYNKQQLSQGVFLQCPICPPWGAFWLDWGTISPWQGQPALELFVGLDPNGLYGFPTQLVDREPRGESFPWSLRLEGRGRQGEQVVCSESCSDTPAAFVLSLRKWRKAVSPSLDSWEGPLNPILALVILPGTQGQRIISLASRIGWGLEAKQVPRKGTHTSLPQKADA